MEKLGSMSKLSAFLGMSISGKRAQREEVPPGIIHPLNLWYRAWWYVTVVVSAITGFLMPYSAAFCNPGLYPYGSASSILVYVMWAVIVVDMVLNFRVARYVRGELMTSPRKIVRNYMCGLFWVDLASSVVPFDEIALAIAGLSGPNYVNNPTLAYYLALARLVAMLRMYRLWWFFSFLQYDVGTSLMGVVLIKNATQTFLIANFEACLLYFVALQQGLGDSTWVGALGGGWFYPSDNTSQLYVYSLYWATIMMSTIGFGDMHAYSPVEAGIVVVIVLFNLFYFAYIIGSVTQVVMSGDVRVRQYREHMGHLVAFAKMHDLPPVRPAPALCAGSDLLESMAGHLKLHFNNQDSQDSHVLAAYPSTIRRRVLRYLYLDVLLDSEARRLFHGAKQRFLDALLAAARLELYLPKVEVLSEGDHVNEDVELDRDRSVRGGHTRVLREGDSMGAIPFFTACEQSGAVHTTTLVRILAISKSSYESIAERFPESARAVLNNLLAQAEEASVEQFPGIQGATLYHSILTSEKANTLQFGGADGRGVKGADSDGAQLVMNPRQGQVVGNLLRAKALVAQFVAKHDEDRITEFLYACSRGDNATLRRMLDQGFSVSSADYDGRTGLMLACVKGFAETAELLLAAGAQASACSRPAAGPNTKDAFGGTAMWEACKSGREECIMLLLRNGGSLGRTGVEEASLLCTCVFSGELKLLQRLLKVVTSGGGLTGGRAAILRCVRVVFGRELLVASLSAAEGNLPAVQLLVGKGGADPRCEDRWGATPLDEARRVGAAAVVEYLEQHAARSGPSGEG
eukprot:scaffold4.g5048.t1